MSGAAPPPNHSRPPAEALLDALEKGYLGLHVEQGVPVLDRDLNLLGDLLRAGLRGLAARYIGDGVAAGSQAFAIAAVEEEDEDDDGDPGNDFRILAGAEPPGRCLVGGIEASITESLRYREQGDAGGRPPELSPPTDDDPDPRVDLAYLDVWLAEEIGAHDPALANPDDVGLRTSTRTQVRWRVRVAEGGQPPEPDPRHVHLPLARLRRPRDEPRIRPDHITDLRRTHLNLAEVEGRVDVLERLPGRLVPDLFDVAPGEYEEGGGRPTVSVREALNGLLRGEVPATPLRPLADPVTEDGDAHAARLPDGSTLVAWTQRREDDEHEHEVMVRRLREDGGPGPRQVTDGASRPSEVRVVPLGGDQVLLAYLVQFGPRGRRRVSFKIAPVDGLADAPEHHIEGLHGETYMDLSVVRTGKLVTFVVHFVEPGPGGVACRRLRWTSEPDDWWIDESLRYLSDSGGARELTAMADDEGRVWAAFSARSGVGMTIRVIRFDPGASSVSVDDEWSLGDVNAGHPTLHFPEDGGPWLFARLVEDGKLVGFRFGGEEWQPEMHFGRQRPGGPVAPVNAADGALWLFWPRQVVEDTVLGEIAIARRDPDTGGWSRPGAATPSSTITSAPIAVADEDAKSIWLVYGRSVPDGPQVLHHRKVVTVF